MSTVDVIVPCYRYGHFLRQCVHSVLSQTGVDVRVLIIDDESPDDTPAVARQLCAEDARVTYRRHQINQGHIATYNEGIAWISNEYYLLLSADDFLLPGALARAAAQMDAEPQVALCFGSALELHPDRPLQPASMGTEHMLGSQSRLLSGEEFIELTRRCGSHNIVPTPTAVVRTAVQKRIVGYRPELPHSGDMELWLRLATHGTIGFVFEPQAVYRRHAANMSLAYSGANHLSDLRQRCQAIELAFGGSTPTMQDWHSVQFGLLKPLAQECLNCASAALTQGRKDLALDFAALALSADPRATRSLSWLRYTCKRHIGPHWSRRLHPLYAVCRSTAARVLR
jgi:glycosyltransferase involved in cell wall biosynthesis